MKIQNKEEFKMENLVVYGIYPNQQAAEQAVLSLRNSGFRLADVSVLLSSPGSTKEFSHVNGTKAPEGAVYGASSGVLAGGAFGLLAGIGAIAIPGVGPLIAAGPIMATLAGIGAGSVTGGVVGALVGAGFPEYEAKRFEGRIAKGGILLSVHADDSQWQEKAEKILEETGATDISSTTESSADSGKDQKPYVQNL